MAVGCGAKISRLLLIVFNILFWLAGAAFIALGAWLLIDKTWKDYFDLLEEVESDSYVHYAAWGLIGLGAFMFTVGFFGCCGAIRESRCCLGVYIALVLLAFLGQVAVAVLVLLYKNDINDILTDELVDALREDYNETDRGSSLSVVFNAIQIREKCCGVNGPDDYNDTLWFKHWRAGEHADSLVPYSCCVMKSDVDDPRDDSYQEVKEHISNLRGCQLRQQGAYYAEGCYDTIKDKIDGSAYFLVGVPLGVVLFEIMVILFAVCLCRNVEDDDGKFV